MTNNIPRTSVLYVGPFNGWGARERGLIREARQAKELGIEVIICCPLESYIHLEAKKFGIETFPVRAARAGRWLGTYRDVFKFLHKRHKFTHFHCYDSLSVFSTALFLRRHPEVALVWSLHGTPPSLAGRWWQRLLLSRTDRFLLPSSISITRIAERYGVSAHKIARVGLAIDVGELSWTPPSREEGFVIGLSLPDTHELLLSVENALRALSLVRYRGIENACLLLHTPQDWDHSVWRSRLDEMIAAAELTDAVEFVSGEDFTLFVRRLHLTLCPEGEEVPFDQVEASLLASIPVVYPRNRAYRELLHDIPAGLFSYKPSDAREMSEKILKLHKDWEKERDAMEELRSQHAKWHHPEQVRLKLLAVYKRTMLRRKKYWRDLL